MRLTAIAAATMTVAWGLAPLVAVGRHGTLDDQWRTAIRAEVGRLEARLGDAARTPPTVPAPRAAEGPAPTASAAPCAVPSLVVG